MAANTLTNLIPTLYQALEVVSRELVGFIPAVTRDSNVARAAVGQTVRSFVAPAVTAGDITPAVTPPDDGEQTIGNIELGITKARRIPIRWQGEESLQMNNGGPGVSAIMVDQFAQAMRTLCNEIEADLAALHITTSRAFGTATTNPFASNLTDTANVRKILSDNGAPLSDMQLVIDTGAGAAMRTLTQLTKANEAADQSMLRQGVLLDVHGLQIRESAQVKRPAVGTGAGYTSSTAGFPVDATVIAIITGTGTVLAGDVVTFAGDTNKYVVAVGVASAGNITLAAPGLRQALPAEAIAMTVVAISSRNMAFSRSALILATRMPALPEGGDMAKDRIKIVDPRSGLSFEVANYLQYRQTQFEISVVWGVKNVKTAHTAILLGA